MSLGRECSISLQIFRQALSCPSPMLTSSMLTSMHSYLTVFLQILKAYSVIAGREVFHIQLRLQGALVYSVPNTGNHKTTWNPWNTIRSVHTRKSIKTVLSQRMEPNKSRGNALSEVPVIDMEGVRCDGEDNSHIKIPNVG